MGWIQDEKIGVDDLNDLCNAVAMLLMIPHGANFPRTISRFITPSTHDHISTHDAYSFKWELLGVASQT